MALCRALDQGYFSPDYLYGNIALNSLVANKSVVPVCHPSVFRRDLEL